MAEFRSVLLVVAIYYNRLEVMYLRMCQRVNGCTSDVCIAQLFHLKS